MGVNQKKNLHEENNEVSLKVEAVFLSIVSYVVEDLNVNIKKCYKSESVIEHGQQSH